MRSPWDGASRAPLRVLLAGLLASDALLTAWLLDGLRPSERSHPQAPAWLLALGGNRAMLLACVLVTWLAAARFARRAGRCWSGLLAVLGVGVLVEAHAAIMEGPWRFLFFGGACAAGWSFGLVFAHWQGLSLDDPRDERSIEAFAEQGAVSVLAACYVGAFICKLAASGWRWAGDAALRPTIAAQHVWGRSAAIDALVTYLLEHAWPTQAMAAFTLVAQATAFAMPFSLRGRRVAAFLLLCFHAGVWLLTPIVFPQAMLLLLVFCLPPASCLPRAARTADPTSLRATSLDASGASRAVLVIAVVGALAWSPGVRAYTARERRPAAAANDAGALP